MGAEDYIRRINKYFESTCKLIYAHFLFTTKRILEYDDAIGNGKFMNCTSRKEDDKLCLFSKQSLGPCGTGDYGYNEGKPCFYLKLNKVTINITIRPNNKI